MIVDKIKCPYCGYVMPLKVDPDAKCKGVWIKCKGRNCKKEFEIKILPGYINAEKGIDLADGWIPETDFFLWDDEKIVGLFRVRHYLTPALANGGGHIGYGIKKECREKECRTKWRSRKKSIWSI